MSRYVALSQDLANWLETSAGVAPQKISQIYNGVDTEKFSFTKYRLPLPVENFSPKDGIVIGTIGRMQPEKDQLTLVRAFIALLDTVENGSERLRLVLIGDGPLREQVQALLREAGVEHLAWLPGVRSDAAEMMQALDIFVLPSLIEGVSNTILEAMATGLPVVATAVGGNPELVSQEKTGVTVPAADEAAMSRAIQRYIDAPELRNTHGKAGLLRVEKMFSMASMVNGYLQVYDGVLCGSESTIEYVREQ
ncbi:FIG040338: Glycosyl transferase [hydrothermal vent metagenome]|uniref:FIG040338: Glycosyl transferase n=1 Tax=hydrothermal vent metagenome TaxID=652676 RepID=A0A3B1B531_9ZZZZ